MVSEDLAQETSRLRKSPVAARSGWTDEDPTPFGKKTSPAGFGSACTQRRARHKRGKRGKSSQLPPFRAFQQEPGQETSFSVDD
jgi:hypothetical protein